MRIAFLYAGLNDLDILSCDIANAYLNAECTEKLWYEAGAEFGSDKGKVMILGKAVCGLKSAANAWRQTLLEVIQGMGYVPNKGDQDLYTRKAKNSKGEWYYEWLLVYVDDLLCISENPRRTIDGLSKAYDLKDSVRRPERYLGANAHKWRMPTGDQEFWATSPTDYVKNAVKQVKRILEDRGEAVPTP